MVNGDEQRATNIDEVSVVMWQRCVSVFVSGHIMPALNLLFCPCPSRPIQVAFHPPRRFSGLYPLEFLRSCGLSLQDRLSTHARSSIIVHRPPCLRVLRIVSARLWSFPSLHSPRTLSTAGLAFGLGVALVAVVVKLPSPVRQRFYVYSLPPLKYC